MRLSQSLLSGLFFLAFGGCWLFAGKDLEMGTTGEMGTGYTPRMLAYGLFFIGALLLVKAIVLRSSEARALPSIALRPLIIVTVMTVAFALLLPRLGLPITVATLILASAVAGEKIRWSLLCALALGVAVLTTILFAYALRLQFPVWPS